MTDKDPALLDLLAKIDEAVGRDRYEIVDHWDGDQIAIGISKVGEPGRLVYISVGIDKKDRYYVECESPTEDDGSLGYRVENARKDCDLVELLQMVKSHKGLS